MRVPSTVPCGAPDFTDSLLDTWCFLETIYLLASFGKPLLHAFNKVTSTSIYLVIVYVTPYQRLCKKM